VGSAAWRLDGFGHIHFARIAEYFPRLVLVYHREVHIRTVLNSKVDTVVCAERAASLACGRVTFQKKKDGTRMEVEADR
jgi:hypothetical protein